MGALGSLSFWVFAQITEGKWSIQVPQSLCDAPEGAADGTSQPRVMESWRPRQPLCHGADRACPCVLPDCQPPSLPTWNLPRKSQVRSLLAPQREVGLFVSLEE